jgi:hypothetical protein
LLLHTLPLPEVGVTPDHAGVAAPFVQAQPRQNKKGGSRGATKGKASKTGVTQAGVKKAQGATKKARSQAAAAATAAAAAVMVAAAGAGVEMPVAVPNPQVRS